MSPFWRLEFGVGSYIFGKFSDPVHYSSCEVNLLVMGTSSIGTNHGHTVPTRQGRGWVANTNKSALKKSNPSRPEQSRITEGCDLIVLFHVTDREVKFDRNIAPYDTKSIYTTVPHKSCQTPP